LRPSVAHHRERAVHDHLLDLQRIGRLWRLLRQLSELALTRVCVVGAVRRPADQIRRPYGQRAWIIAAIGCFDPLRECATDVAFSESACAMPAASSRLANKRCLMTAILAVVAHLTPRRARTKRASAERSVSCGEPPIYAARICARARPPPPRSRSAHDRWPRA